MAARADSGAAGAQVIERFTARLLAAAAAGDAPDWNALRGEAAAAGDPALLRLAEAIEASCAAAERKPAAALEAYFDYALHGIVETAADGRIQRCNPAAASILGASQRRLAGATLEAALAPDADAQRRLARHRDALAEQGVNLTTLQIDLGGSRRTLELASVDIGEARHLHILDDITEQRQLTESLEAARRAADEANAAKSAFLANMSHEIRTPLNGIIGLERLLRTTPLTPQQREYLDDMRQSSATLLALLGGILDLSKIEAGRFETGSQPFDLDDLIETVATACAPAAAGKPVRLVFDIDPRLPRRVAGDAVRLAQVLNNLLANALKFTDAGRVALAIAPAPGSEGGSRLRFAVRDTGIGMTADQLARVFSPFVQADESVTRRFGGTGLGLAIARGIATALGGTITATSEAGVGSEFVFEAPVGLPEGAASPRAGAPAGRAIVFASDAQQRGALAALLAAESYAVEARDSLPDPAVLANDDGAALLIIDGTADGRYAGMADRPPGAAPLILLTPPASTLEPAAGIAILRAPATPLRLRRAIAHCGARAPVAIDFGMRGEFTGTTALLVEDFAINRRVAAHLLDYAGIDVIVAEDGEAACAALLGPAARRVDIVLMDVQMPVMDGLTATRKLRAAGVTTTIVALTAGVSHEEREACMEAGMNDWLAKPIDSDELEAVLTRWLPVRRARGPEIGAAAELRALPKIGAAAELPAMLPGIDLDSALERFLGNRPALMRALAAFVGTQRGVLESAPLLAASGDHAALLRHLHTLAGGAATLGAVELAAAAQAFADDLRGGQPAPFDGAQRRLQDAFAVVASAIARHPG